MFGADQSTIVFILHTFAFGYSFRYTLAVVFPVYFLINIATIIKIKYDTSIETTDKQFLSVMQRVLIIGLGILFSKFLVDFDKAESFLKSHLMKN